MSPCLPCGCDPEAGWTCQGHNAASTEIQRLNQLVVTLDDEAQRYRAVLEDICTASISTLEGAVVRAKWALGKK